MPPANRSIPSDLGQEACEIGRYIAALRRGGHRRFGVSDLPADGSIDAFEAAFGASTEHHEEVVRRRLADRSRDLAEAFERVRDGTYGTCQACGCRIPRRRLQVLPTATLCVTCQEQREVDRAA